jgi:hypothetical protein
MWDTRYERKSVIVFQACHGWLIDDLAGCKIKKKIFAIAAAACKLRIAGTDSLQIDAVHGIFSSRSLSIREHRV